MQPSFTTKKVDHASTRQGIGMRLRTDTNELKSNSRNVRFSFLVYHPPPTDNFEAITFHSEVVIPHSDAITTHSEAITTHQWGHHL